ncbi:MAG: hypothetical protein F6K50_24800 [Moorea sp. SIO3I7]|uniref:hypothetical protein n=1 Tax=Moorena sp. SIO3I8 TaxID=2607833 RepID=UPI0013C1FC1B|nr:hypothetical protein [Moorena sp. SIO3I8]NEN98609.1 hypothetical protein [Moorena sp. SIO3I7]NEO08237.1 hypothetical protein [Moorena sp. SIO3I8]
MRSQQLIGLGLGLLATRGAFGPRGARLATLSDWPWPWPIGHAGRVWATRGAFGHAKRTGG